MELVSTIKDTANYLLNLNFTDKNNLKNKINYEIGVPLKELNKIKNINDLIETCNKYKNFPSEFQKDLEQEVKYYLTKQL